MLVWLCRRVLKRPHVTRHPIRQARRATSTTSAASAVVAKKLAIGWVCVVATGGWPGSAGERGNEAPGLYRTLPPVAEAVLAPSAPQVPLAAFGAPSAPQRLPEPSSLWLLASLLGLFGLLSIRR